MDSPSRKLTPCHFKLPLADNDGQAVAEELREELLDRVWVEFGGYTIEGVEEGAYRRQDTGKKQVEKLLRVAVAVEGEAGVNRLREIVSEIGGRLHQECMYFEVSVGSVGQLVPSKKKGGR
jgi:hypothetical protein